MDEDEVAAHQTRDPVHSRPSTSPPDPTCHALVFITCHYHLLLLVFPFWPHPFQLPRAAAVRVALLNDTWVRSHVGTSDRNGVALTVLFYFPPTQAERWSLPLSLAPFLRSGPSRVGEFTVASLLPRVQLSQFGWILFNSDGYCLHHIIIHIFFFDLEPYTNTNSEFQTWVASEWINHRFGSKTNNIDG